MSKITKGRHNVLVYENRTLKQGDWSQSNFHKAAAKKRRAARKQAGA